MAEEEKRKVVVSVALSVDEYLRLEEAVVRKHGRKWLSLIHISEPTRPY